MEHVVGVPWHMLRGFHSTCSMGHVARAPWDMFQRLHGICCEGFMGYTTCCEGSMDHVMRVL